MFELSLTFDTPSDSTSVSGEQTQVRLDEFRQMSWLKPDWEEATRTALQVIERHYRRYVLYVSAYGSKVLWADFCLPMVGCGSGRFWYTLFHSPGLGGAE